MMKYVVGFVSYKQTSVLLQRKAKPEWQKGRLNGPGGKIEGNETPQEAVAREIAEETTLVTLPAQWQHYATLRRGGHDGWEVMFLSYEHYEELDSIQTLDKAEPLVVLPVGELVARPATDMIQNLKWLIPLAFDTTIKTPVLVEDTYP